MIIQWIKFCSIKSGKVKSEQGFTLVEVIFVFVVMSILSSTLVLAHLTSLNQGIEADIYVTASQLASADIENLRETVRGSGNLNDIIGLADINTSINNRTYVSSFANTRVQSDLITPDGTGDYVIVVATVTETVSNPDIAVTIYGIISQDYH